MRLERHDFGKIPQHGAQVEVDCFHLQFARLDLGKVQDVVDQPEKRLTAGPHRLCILALFVGKIGVEQ